MIWIVVDTRNIQGMYCHQNVGVNVNRIDSCPVRWKQLNNVKTSKSSNTAHRRKNDVQKNICHLQEMDATVKAFLNIAWKLLKNVNGIWKASVSENRAVGKWMTVRHMSV